MSTSLLNTIYLGCAYLVLFSSAEIFYHKFNFKVELTRKYVHVNTGILTLFFPFLIADIWLVMLLCGSFLLILLTSIKFKLLKSINAVERDTNGSILYPIIVFCCYVIYIKSGQLHLYYIPIMILAISDPLATLIGDKWPRIPYKTFNHTKTLSASVGFFVSALILCTGIIWAVDPYTFSTTLLISICVALAATIAEAYSHKGWDNFTIPVSAVLVLILFDSYQG